MSVCVLEAMEDEELVLRYKEGELEVFEVLLERYSERIQYLARKYYSSKGLTQNDFYQEGAIGLFYAIKKFDPERNVAFFYFASMHIRSQMINTIKSAGRKKHKLLNDALSIDVSFDEGESGGLWIETLRHGEPSPEEYYFNCYEQQHQREQFDYFFRQLLSPLERKVLNALCTGISYQEAAQRLGVGTKTIDNALCRVKVKYANLSFQEKKNKMIK